MTPKTVLTNHFQHVGRCIAIFPLTGVVARSFYCIIHQDDGVIQLKQSIFKVLMQGVAFMISILLMPRVSLTAERRMQRGGMGGEGGGIYLCGSDSMLLMQTRWRA